MPHRLRLIPGRNDEGPGNRAFVLLRQGCGVQFPGSASRAASSVALGRIGDKTFAFVGLERMGGVLVYDITDPQAPTRVDYLNPREDWTTEDPATVLANVGDLGPEGLAFIPAEQSPSGDPLLLVGNEVSGTTSVLRLNLTY